MFGTSSRVHWQPMPIALMIVWATDKLNVDVVTVPKETLVKVKLLSELDSSKIRWDPVRYRVLEDVIIKIAWIPAGTEGVIGGGQQCQASWPDGHSRISALSPPSMERQLP